MAEKKATKKKKKAPRKGMGVYDIKQATTIQGKPDKRMSRMVREGHLITNAYADEINAGYKVTGKYAEFDEDATAEYEKAAKGKATKDDKKS